MGFGDHGLTASATSPTASFCIEIDRASAGEATRFKLSRDASDALGQLPDGRPLAHARRSRECVREPGDRPGKSDFDGVDRRRQGTLGTDVAAVLWRQTRRQLFRRVGRFGRFLNSYSGVTDGA